jgi:quercetin dioxygenase-like cupin family protein
MKVTRLYTGPDRESHFEDVEVPLAKLEDLVRASAAAKATGVSFREVGTNYQSDWHTAPRRQYVVILGGEIEIELGNELGRRFGPGDVLLAEDTKGKGHITRTIGDKPRISMVVTLE